MSDLDLTKLRPGDIVLLHDETSNTTWKHQAIKMGQSLASLSLLRRNLGDAALVHALLWTRHPSNPQEPETAEASGTGKVRVTPIRRGLYEIYRPRNENLGDWAAQVAMMWGIDEKISYSKPMSVLSVAHSSTFGPQGQARAQSYAKDAFSNDPAWGADGSFCSQFVIAAYQAAAGQIGLPLVGMLAMDAKHTSVRTLHHALLLDPGHFWCIGQVRVERGGSH